MDKTRWGGLGKPRRATDRRPTCDLRFLGRRRSLREMIEPDDCQTLKVKEFMEMEMQLQLIHWVCKNMGYLAKQGGVSPIGVHALAVCPYCTSVELRDSGCSTTSATGRVAS
jgi:hypothetical protein